MSNLVSDTIQEDLELAARAAGAMKEAKPPISREDVLAHLHLLEPQDIDRMVRLELVIPGRITTGRHFRVINGPRRFDFHKKGGEHVLECASVAAGIDASFVIGKKKPQFHLFTRVTLRCADASSSQLSTLNSQLAETPAPEPVDGMDKMDTMDGIEVASGSPENPEITKRREALIRSPEHYLQSRAKHYKLKVPIHNAKLQLVDSILGYEFPESGIKFESLEEKEVPKTPEITEDTEEKKGGESSSSSDPLEVIESTSETTETAVAQPSTLNSQPRSQAELQDMPWDELKALGKSLGLPGKSRAELVAQALSLSSQPSTLN